MFDKARKLLPDDPALLVDYGRILEGSGRQRDAIGKFEAALALNEKVPPTYLGLGKQIGLQFGDREIEELERLERQQGG